MLSDADWRTTLTESFRDPAGLARFLDWPLATSVTAAYPLLITRRLAQRIQAEGPDGVLARQFLPAKAELLPGGLADPISDQAHAPTRQLIHRYGNRALLIPTSVCPVHCRYCFRKNELGADGAFTQERERSLTYLREHPEINEIILTGGDPLMLTDEKLDEWLTQLAAIPHIQWIRFHSRVPVILPERLTPGLANLFERHAGRFKKLLMVVHTNHVAEWDGETRERVRAFRPAGLEWLAQTVLLRGVNDHEQTLFELFTQLAEDGIRAYYLHHPDQVKGAMHFGLPLSEGRRLYGQLRNRLPGWALPTYVVEAPEGGGKVPAFNPESHNFSGTLLDRYGNPRQAPDHAAQL